MCLSAFAAEGLLRVVRLLESLPDKEFDLSSWHNPSPCGTTYCAMGYATCNDWFRQHGLHLNGCGNPELRLEDGTTRIGFNAVAVFFGISGPAAEFLFMPQRGYGTRRQVITRIRRFVAMDGERWAGNLRKAEVERLDRLLAELDARLALEQGNAQALLRKTMAKGEQLIPAG